MTTLRSRMQQIVIDWRIWILTVLLLGWYSFERVVPGGGPDILFAPIDTVMFVYYYSVGLVFLYVGSEIGLWIGFAVFTFVVAALVVLVLERARRIV